ncbi:trypsin-like [Phlebotomus papatasi]|uniref:trypsin-like n=1 Tax=Phlebotomus papatasi TaxID=29031 RepID=UPI002483BBE2|nr:trypsin-like [Phlebotomus papatasi]
MLKIAILIALVGCSLGSNLLDENVPENFVMGGTNVAQGEFPWTVLVRVLNNFAQGVVLNDRHILTAASVVTEGNRSINHFWVRITAGDNHVLGTSMNREERTLSHLFIHDHFNHLTGVNNLAVLRLSTPFLFPHNTIEGAILNSRIIPVGTSVQFAGWQFPIPVAENQRMLRSFSMNTITNAVCTTPPANTNRILTNMFCCGQLTPAPTNSPCNGNQGGGVYFNRQLIGIFHDGITCNQVNNPSIFMDVRFYLDWINQTYNRTDLTPPGTEFPRATPAVDQQ